MAVNIRVLLKAEMVAPTTLNPAYTSGTFSRLIVDKDTSALLVHSQNLEDSKEGVSAFPPKRPATITVTGSSGTSVQIAPSNGGRPGIIVANLGTTTMYGRFGTTAAMTTNASFVIPSGEHREFTGAMATDAIQDIWSSSPTGNACVTQVTSS